MVAVHSKKQLSAFNHPLFIGCLAAALFSTHGIFAADPFKQSVLDKLQNNAIAIFPALREEATKSGANQDFIDQIAIFEQNISNISDGEVIYLGIPKDKASDMDARTKFGRVYLLSSTFRNTASQYDNDHYELYFMPKGSCLASVFLNLNNWLKTTANNSVAFLGVRPTPGVTQSAYNFKNLPRIIVSFNPTATRDEVAAVIQALSKDSDYDPARCGFDIQPRYSHKINNLMYVAYGSADYKDTKAFQNTYEANKKNRTWKEWWYAPTVDEDLAFTDPSQKIDLTTIAAVTPAQPQEELLKSIRELKQGINIGQAQQQTLAYDIKSLQDEFARIKADITQLEQIRSYDNITSMIAYTQSIFLASIQKAMQRNKDPQTATQLKEFDSAVKQFVREHTTWLSNNMPSAPPLNQ